MSFQTLGLKPELLRAIAENGYETPTPVQARAIPEVLAGRDLLAGAQTGTGKTAGFTLPILQLLGTPKAGAPAAENSTHRNGWRAPRALVLVPTRELAAQVAESARDLRPVHADGCHRRVRWRRFQSAGGKPAPWHRHRCGDAGPAARPCAAAHHRPVARSRFSCSMKPTACSTWASFTTSAASSSCCRPSGRT